MFVRFKNGQVYGYMGVTRQRTVALVRQPSVGQYVNTVIKTRFPSLRVPELD